MTKLTIFHYHLLPGGVTKVITLSVKAVIRYFPEITNITLISGSKENTGNIRAELGKYAAEKRSRISIDIEIIPEIGYLDETGEISGKKLDKLLIKKYGGSLFWIHNYQLGKNPGFTQAILRAAEENPREKFLLHIHDFPECSRYENIRMLNSYPGRPLYPAAANIRYAVINSRDREMLESAGIPGKYLFLLNDPVETAPVPKGDREKINEKLKRAFSGDFPAYNPGMPSLFYPVRTIRRKNILEAGLIAAVSRPSYNLIATLPGVSAQEKPYSDIVEKAYSAGLIPGLWGIGARLNRAGINFSELASASEIIISSSIQEGFGYLFLDSIGWGRPIFARDLDILNGIRKFFDGTPSHFYSEFRIPLSKSLRSEMITEYNSKLDRIPVYLPETRIKELREEINNLFRGSSADFSFLSAGHQYGILEQTKDGGFAGEVRELNGSALSILDSLAGLKPEITNGEIEKVFGFHPFISVLKDILRSYNEEPVKKETVKADIQQNLINRFASMEYLRLLYE